MPTTPPISIQQSPPTITFTIEPVEDRTVVYQRIAPRFKGDPASAMLFFTLTVTNTDTPRTLTEIRVSFPGSDEPPTSFAMDTLIPHGERAVEMDGARAIHLYKFPTELTVELVFSDGPHAVSTWRLGPHPISYSFPLRREPPGHGELAALPGIHVEGGGVQHFGYDMTVLGWNQDGTLSRVRTDGAKNEDYFSFGRPFYAMADGLVVYATDIHPDNPSPDGRAFERRVGEYVSEGAPTAIAVTNLAREGQPLSRFLVTVASAGKLRVLAFEQDRHGDQLKLLAEAGGALAEQVSAARLTSSSAVTASLAGSHGSLILWTIPKAGPLVGQAAIDMPGLSALKVFALTATTVLTVARSTGGKLQLAVWGLQGGKLGSSPLGTDDGGTIGGFDAVAMDGGQRAIVAAQVLGDLKLIAWDLVPDGKGGVSPVRRGELRQGVIDEVSLVTMEAYPDQVVGAVRTGGTVKLIAWEVSDAGEFVRRGDAELGPGSLVNLSALKKKAVAVAFRSAAGNLRITMQNCEQAKETKVMQFRELSAREFAGIEALATDTVPTDQPTLVTASRLKDGHLKVSLWQFTDNNTICVLHGDELVYLAHLQQGSLAKGLMADTPVPVKRGVPLGRMGHAGASAGPHMHMHAVRVRAELLADLTKLRETLRAGDVPGTARPLHFDKVRVISASAMETDLGGTEISAQGTYFTTYLVSPGEDPT